MATLADYMLTRDEVEAYDITLLELLHTMLNTRNAPGNLQPQVPSMDSQHLLPIQSSSDQLLPSVGTIVRLRMIQNQYLHASLRMAKLQTILLQQAAAESQQRLESAMAQWQQIDGSQLSIPSASNFSASVSSSSSSPSSPVQFLCPPSLPQPMPPPTHRLPRTLIKKVGAGSPVPVLGDCLPVA